MKTGNEHSSDMDLDLCGLSLSYSSTKLQN